MSTARGPLHILEVCAVRDACGLITAGVSSIRDFAALSRGMPVQELPPSTNWGHWQCATRSSGSFQQSALHLQHLIRHLADPLDWRVALRAIAVAARGCDIVLSGGASTHWKGNADKQAPRVAGGAKSVVATADTHDVRRQVETGGPGTNSNIRSASEQ